MQRGIEVEVFQLWLYLRAAAASRNLMERRVDCETQHLANDGWLVCPGPLFFVAAHLLLVSAAPGINKPP